MKILLVLPLFFAATLANECRVSDWGTWSACLPECEAKEVPSSWQVPEYEGWDVGRDMMHNAMKVKQKKRAETRACKQDGTCAHLFGDSRSGFVQCVSGQAGGYPCNNINFLAHLSVADLMGASSTSAEGNDIWGWTDPVTGDTYAIVGLTTGTSFVRITDPQNPVPVAFMNSHNNRASIWRDMKVIQDHAYIVSEARSHGMQVFDLTRLRNMNSLSTVSPDLRYSGFGNAHNIVANEASNTLFVVGATSSGIGYTTCSGGLHMIDVSSPKSPTFVGCYSSDGYTHDAECVIYTGPDSNYNGREVCFAYNEDSLTIVDVTSKGSPTMISKRLYSGVQYSHQGWITEDQTVLLLDDELDEDKSSDKRTRTYVWDIKQLSDPVLRNVHYSSESSIDHNQYIIGDYTYQSNYEAGLRVLRINQQDFTLTETGYFDVYPSSTLAQFSGSWSNYAYLPNNVVAVTSIEGGLFMVQVDMAAMEQSYQQIQQRDGHAGVRHRERTLLKSSKTCPALEESKTCVTYVDC